MSRPSYSEAFAEALHFAAELHRDQRRKSTTVPYVSHLLAVCALVWEDDGTEDEAIAAVLHDAVEDQGGLQTLKDIESRFGDVIARIVIGCSDTTEDPKPPWRARKQAYLDSLATADVSVLKVTAADKLHNVLATTQDLRTQGPAVWDRFNAGANDFLWYHHEVEQVLAARIPESRTVSLLARALRDLEIEAAPAREN